MDLTKCETYLYKNRDFHFHENNTQIETFFLILKIRMEYSPPTTKAKKNKGIK